VGAAVNPDEDRIRQLAKEVAKETVREMLLSLGADSEKPLELQKDFNFVRTQREFYTGAVKHGVFAIMGTLCVGILTVLWTAFKAGGK
jgi:hypothetical protein